MATFLERYQAGEYAQVWAELLELDAQVRDEPYFEDSWAVVRETMRRIRHNIGVVVPRLHEIGYRFGDLYDHRGYWKDVRVFTLPKADAPTRVEEIEAAVGVLPLSLRGWSLWVGQVNLIGFHPEWPDTFDIDPLYVESITSLDGEESKVDYYRDYYEHWQADCEEFGDEEVGPFHIELAPDDYHKANISGGAPYSIAVPCSDIDAPLLYEWHETTFVNYLRICFRWGGFPGFERCAEHLRPIDHIKYLTDDLLEF